MKLHITISFILATTLIACSGDSLNSYVGLWERTNSQFVRVLEISKDGDTYLIDDDILYDKDFLGNKKAPHVLTKSDGKLSIQRAFGSTQLALSKDKKTLRLADRSYKKISISRLNEIKAEEAKKK